MYVFYVQIICDQIVCYEEEIWANEIIKGKHAMVRLPINHHQKIKQIIMLDISLRIINTKSHSNEVKLEHLWSSCYIGPENQDNSWLHPWGEHAYSSPIVINVLII